MQNSLSKKIILITLAAVMIALSAVTLVACADNLDGIYKSTDGEVLRIVIKGNTLTLEHREYLGSNKGFAPEFSPIATATFTRDNNKLILSNKVTVVEPFTLNGEFELIGQNKDTIKWTDTKGFSMECKKIHK